MQEQFQSSFEAKFFAEHSRQRFLRLADPYAVEPWEKNVLQIEIEPPSPGKTLRTCYHTPLRRQERVPDRKNETMRNYFSFRKEHQLQRNSKKWLREVEATQRGSRQSTINHYNINGNSLQQVSSERKKHARSQFTVHPFKAKHDKQAKIEGQTTITLANIEIIKRRVNICREFSMQQDEKYLQMNADPHQYYIYSAAKRRKKVISLGFCKLSLTTHLPKPSKISHLGMQK